MLAHDNSSNNVFASIKSAVSNPSVNQPYTSPTDKKYEGHFRVPPHVLSIGFNVLISLGWPQMRPHPSLAAASDRLPSREGPPCQTERTPLYPTRNRSLVNRREFGRTPGELAQRVPVSVGPSPSYPKPEPMRRTFCPARYRSTNEAAPSHCLRRGLTQALRGWGFKIHP
jgi:hypothetical protein